MSRVEKVQKTVTFDGLLLEEILAYKATLETMAQVKIEFSQVINSLCRIGIREAGDKE